MPRHKARKSPPEQPRSSIVKNFALWLRHRYLQPWLAEARMPSHPDTPHLIKYSLISAAKNFDKALNQERKKNIANQDNLLDIYLSLIDAIIYDGIVSYQPITDPILIINLDKSPIKALNIFQYDASLVNSLDMKEEIDFVHLPTLKIELRNFYQALHQAKLNSKNPKRILDWMDEREIPNGALFNIQPFQTPQPTNPQVFQPICLPSYIESGCMGAGLCLLFSHLTFLTSEVLLQANGDITDNEKQNFINRFFLQGTLAFLAGGAIGVIAKHTLQATARTMTPARTHRLTEMHADLGPHDFEEQNRERTGQRPS